MKIRQIKIVYIISALVTVALLMGCAVKQPIAHDPRDKVEGYNRSIFTFDETLDRVSLKPVANLYQTIVPTPVKAGVYNFFANLDDVPNGVNNLLQGDTRGSRNDLMRLIINSTLGVAGLFDVASRMGLPKHEEDFGQTLAVWGMGPGSYFVLPILGPSTLRDSPALIVDYLLNPLTYIGGGSASFALYVLKNVDKRADFISQEEIVRSWSPDFYAGVRNYYLSRRAALVGNTSLGDEIDDLYEDLN